jgi:putative methyltransferase (TIGR04325 family)
MAQRDSIKGHWLSKPGVKRAIRDTVLAVPLVSDVYRKHWHFLSRLGTCRGIFPTRRDAELAATSLGPVGYNGNLVFGPEIMGEPSDMRKRDYPVMLWLSKSLDEGCKILNLGGSAGTEYFTYRQFLQFPERVIWMVCELPHVVEFGRSLADAVDAPELAFTTRIEDGAGADIFLSCGVLQYLEQDLATCLRRLQPRPPRVLVNRIPLYEGETFFTIQSSLGSVAPYRIQNRQELVDSMIELDYQLVDCWSEKREVVIPFHPQRSVDEFHGFYFASSKVASKDRNRDAIVTAHEVCARIAPLWMPEKLHSIPARA